MIRSMPPEKKLRNLVTCSQSPWPEGALEHLGRCPICESKQRGQLYAGLTDQVFRCAPGEWSLWECNNCGTAYLDPRPKPQSIGLAYTRYYTHGSPRRRRGFLPRLKNLGKEILEWGAHDYLNHRYGYALHPALSGGRLLGSLLSRYARFAEVLIRHLPQATSQDDILLDIGCGNGRFLLEAGRVGYRVMGLEPDEQAADAAKGLGLDVKVGGLPSSGLQRNSICHITMSHVIEHLHDPVAALREAYALLRPTGRIWLATPNFDVIRHFNPSGLSYHLDPPRHLMLFTPRVMRKVLEDAGFRSLSVASPAVDGSIFPLLIETPRTQSNLELYDLSKEPHVSGNNTVVREGGEPCPELFAVAYKS